MSLGLLPDDDVIVADFGCLEFASSISRKHRIRDITLDEADGVLRHFDVWATSIPQHVTLQSVDILFADRMLRTMFFALKAPDAMHLAIAARCEAMLVTFDTQLARAALAMGVAVTPLP